MSDKRSVATDALEVLGLPDLGGRDVGRDAIHLAVEPAVAGEPLNPGERIYRIENGEWYGSGSSRYHLAIVDPFLEQIVPQGGRFLAIIPPRQITSLRHVWSHPDFPDVASTGAPSSEPESSPGMYAVNPCAELVEKEESRRWLIDFAKRLFSYPPYDDYDDDAHDTLSVNDTYLKTLIDGIKYGGRFGTDIEYGDDVQPSEELMLHYERYTGEKAPAMPEYFRCAC